MRRKHEGSEQITENYLSAYIQSGDLIISFSGCVVKNTGEWSAAPHFHTNYELHYVARGSAKLVSKTNTLDVGEGSLCLIAPHCIHYTMENSGGVVHLALNFELNNNKTAAPQKKVGVAAEFSEYGYYSDIFKSVKSSQVFEGGELLRLCCEKLINASNGGRIQSRFGFDAMLRMLFFETAEIVYEINIKKGDAGCAAAKSPNRNANPDSYREEENTRRRWIIDNLISERFYSRLTYDVLSGMLFLSRRQCMRTVKSLTGMTLNELILKQRMNTAMILIETSDMTLDEISGNIGYSSYSGFYTAFKKYFKTAPQNIKGKST